MSGCKLFNVVAVELASSTRKDESESRLDFCLFSLSHAALLFLHLEYSDSGYGLNYTEAEIELTKLVSEVFDH